MSTGETKTHPYRADLHNPQYVGDGVYAWWDGWQVWLCVGHHANDPVVALEPSVMHSIIRYGQENSRADRAESQDAE